MFQKLLPAVFSTSNDDNVWIPMADGPSEWVNQNGISRAMAPGDGGQGNSSHMAKTMVDWLMGTNKASTADDDPSLMIYSGGIAEWTSAAFTTVSWRRQSSEPERYSQRS